MPIAPNSSNPKASRTRRRSARFGGFLLATLCHGLAAQPAVTSIDFGDDASPWSNDLECDDPRFVGEGMAASLLPSDLMHDASDCRSLFLAGEISLEANRAAGLNAGVDFGDNVSAGAFDAACGDPRFAGRGMSPELADTDMFHDAQDCRALYDQGSIRLLPGYSVVLSGRLERGSLRAGDDTRDNGSYSDSYTLIADRGDRIVADLRSGEFDTLLIIRPPRGEDISNDDFQGSSDRSQLTIPRAETGVYELIVSSSAAGETGGYTLWISSDD